MVVNIANNRWVRNTGDFAVNLGEKDLSGLFSRKIVIEEGTAGLLMIHGRYDQRLDPGEHTLEGGLGAILRSKNRKNIVLVSLGEVSLELTLVRLLTKDPVPFTVRTAVTLRFTSGREAVFLSNFMSGRDAIGVNELKSLVYAELKEGAQDWAGRHTINELAEDLALRDELAMTLESHLRPLLDRYGLSFGRLEVKEFTCEIWDKSVEKRVETSLQVTQEQAELEGRKRLFDVAVERDIQDLAEETQKTATYEKRIELWQRMRRASNKEEMDKITSERDLEDFIRTADHDKVIKEDEFERFKIALEEAGEDKDRFRAHMLRIADMEEQYDYKRKEVAQHTALSREEAEGELGLERLRLESSLETELKRVDLEMERERREADHRRTQDELEAAARYEREIQEAQTEAQTQGVARETSRLDAEMALAIEEKSAAQGRFDEQERTRIELDDRAARQEQDLKAQEAALDLKLKELRDLHQRELETIGAYDGVSLHTLIAVSEDGKAPLLAELARTEALKDMSPEQILAMAAAKSPELGGALAEMTTKGDNVQAKEMYERLLEEQKSASSQARETQQDMTRTMQEMFNKALETQSQVSQAFAQGISQPAPQAAQGGSAQPGTASGPQRVVVCRNCMAESDAGTRFCPNCGATLMNVS
ncbi:MAG: hypothetical protein IIB17_04540 [Chloroflexi bacterium]|nr:hypothetical protein [Chloroflexota bacterium]